MKINRTTLEFSSKKDAEIFGITIFFSHLCIIK